MGKEPCFPSKYQLWDSMETESDTRIRLAKYRLNIYIYILKKHCGFNQYYRNSWPSTGDISAKHEVIVRLISKCKRPPQNGFISFWLRSVPRGDVSSAARGCYFLSAAASSSWGTSRLIQSRSHLSRWPSPRGQTTWPTTTIGSSYRFDRPQIRHIYIMYPKIRERL